MIATEELTLAKAAETSSSVAAEGNDDKSTPSAPIISFERYDNWEGWRVHSPLMKMTIKIILESPDWTKRYSRTDPNQRSHLHALSRLLGLHAVTTETKDNPVITITKPTNWSPPPFLPDPVPLDIDLHDAFTVSNAPDSEVFTTYYAAWNGWNARKPEVQALFKYCFAKFSSPENVNHIYDSLIIKGLKPAQMHEVRHTTPELGLIDRHGNHSGHLIIEKPYDFEYKVPKYAMPFKSLSAKRGKKKTDEKFSKATELATILQDVKCERCQRDGFHCRLVMGNRFQAGRGIICSNCWVDDPYLRGHKNESYETLFMSGTFEDDDWF